jgi:23S rRNA pseudouridine2605 synthase
VIRLQKLLASAGLGSRRAIEEWIRAGRVTLNGRPAQLGDRAGPADDLRVDGRRVTVGPATEPPPPELLLYHKPLGEVTTRRDPEGRPTVFERLPAPRHGRWINVGRLDVNTSGLLLFTTDGELAHRLMHPSSQIEREYRVRVRGTPDPQVVQRLATEVELEDGPARFELVAPLDGPRSERASEAASHQWYRVVLREGRKREVRRLWAAVGHEVSRLERTRYGPIELPRDLAPARWRLARAAELEALQQATQPARAMRR